MISPKTPAPKLASDRTARENKARAWQTLVLFGLATALYLPSMRFGFIYDDYPLIVRAPVADSVADYAAVFIERHWQGLPYYRPMSRLTMVAQKSLHGNQPAGYHLFNALLMGVACGLCYVLFASPVLGIPRAFAFWAALIFALHPLSSSTVYPICSGRETLIPTVFSLAAMIAWLRATPRSRGLAFFFFACALFSKEQAVVVPVLFVLTDLARLTAGKDDENASSPGGFELLRRHWPSLGILGVYALIRWMLFADTNEHGLALSEAPLGPVYSLLYALQCMFTPFVELVYEPTLTIWLSSWRIGVSLFGAALLIVFAIRAEGPTRRRAFFWLGWMLLTLLPTANVLRQEAPFAERYLLMPLVGLLGTAGTLASFVWEKAMARQLILGLEILAALACGAISFERGPYYRDDISFHTQWVRTNPDSPHARRSLGWAWLEKGDLHRAEQHLQAALNIDPTNAEIWNNLGNIAHRQRQLAQAELLYRTALSLNSRFAECHNNLGTVLGELDRMGEAESHFRKALELRPRYSEAHNGLGIVLASRDKTQEALAHFKEAVEHDPQNAQAHRNLARALASLGEHEEAQKHLERVRELEQSH